MSNFHPLEFVGGGSKTHFKWIKNEILYLSTLCDIYSKEVIPCNRSKVLFYIIKT